MSQTSIADRMDTYVEGQLADNGLRKRTEGMMNEEASAAIPFGRMVAQGAADNGALLCAATDDKLAGISHFGHAYARPENVDTDGVQPGAMFDVLRRGRVAVMPEDVVTPASEVHVRMVASLDGSALVVADFTFTAEADTEIFTAADHGLETGDGPFQVSNSGGALPTGLAAATNYWVIKVDDDNFKLATTRANALAGTNLSITDDGTGTQTMSDTASTERYESRAAGTFRGTPGGRPLVVADFTFTAEADTEVFTAVAHGLLTGDGPLQVSNSGGALPAGLAAATDYWVIKIDNDTFYLATSRANAIAGTNLSITTDGTGTQTAADTVNTERLTTLNITKMAQWRTSGDGNEDEAAVLEIDMAQAALATVG